MGRVDTPVGPVELTFELPFSSSNCIYGPGRRCPSFRYGPDGQGPTLVRFSTPKGSRQPFAEAVVHTSGFYALPQFSSYRESSHDGVLHHHAV